MKHSCPPSFILPWQYALSLYRLGQPHQICVPLGARQSDWYDWTDQAGLLMRRLKAMHANYTRQLQALLAAYRMADLDPTTWAQRHRRQSAKGLLAFGPDSDHLEGRIKSTARARERYLHCLTYAADYEWRFYAYLDTLGVLRGNWFGPPHEPGLWPAEWRLIE